MPRIPIADLLSNSPVDPSAHLDVRRVEHYAEIFDELPPVVVFQMEERLLLVDGYHRVAAARLRGEDHVEAEVRRGSRADALRFAARLGAAQEGLTEDEVRRRIERHGDQAGGVTPGS
ncbi:ParB N-terminal domain-containing protein [Streptosporangium carneum]|nr:ParB N-terminal domain-containing protein [Streptosporangium carneum]